MKKYMILIEDLYGCVSSFFDDYNSAMDYAESFKSSGYWTELYERRERWIENHIAGFEYRRVN